MLPNGRGAKGHGMLITGLADMSIYYFASTISAAVCRGCLKLEGEKAWRIPCLLQTVGPAVAILMTLTAPESPRVSKPDL